MFQDSGESEDNLERLTEELFLIVKNNRDKEPEQQSARATQSLSEDQWKALPEAGKSLKRAINRWYDERRHWKHQITVLHEKLKRFEAAKKVVELTREIKEGWAQLDYWKKYGELPGLMAEGKFSEIEGMSIIALLKRKENLRTYISREKKIAEKDTHVREMMAEMAAIVKRLAVLC